MSPARDIKIASLNARGIKASARFNELATWMLAQDIDILCLQETHMTEDDAAIARNRHPNIWVATNCGDDPYAGVTTLVRANKMSESNDHPKVYRDAGGRLLITTCTMPAFTVTVANVYLPAEVNRRRQYLEDQVSRSVDNLLLLEADIYCGDWNMIESSRDRKNCRDSAVQDRSLLRHFIAAYGLRGTEFDDGWRLRNPEERTYTHMNAASQGESRIDRIYLRTDWMRQAHSWGIWQVPFNADHKRVEVTITPIEKLQRGPGRKRFNIQTLQNKDVVAKIYDGLMAQRANGLKGWMSWKSEVSKTYAQTAKSVKTLSKKRTRLMGKVLRARRRGDLQDSEQELQIAAAEGELHAFEDWSAQNYAANSLAKHRLWGEKPNRWFLGRMKTNDKMAQRVTGLKNNAGEVVTDPSGMTEVVREFYSRLLDEKPSEQAARERLLGAVPPGRMLSNERRAMLVKPISTKEVYRAIAGGTRGSAPGPDGLPWELLKEIIHEDSRRGVADGAEFIAEVLNVIMTAGHMPKGFTDGVLAILWKKKGDATDLKYYRPLSILNVDYRMFTGILTKRLLKALDGAIGSQQCAFMPGRLIDDNVRTVQGLVSRATIGPQYGTTILYVDQEKAYDRVSHVYLWEAMRRFGIPEGFIDVVKRLYLNATLTAYVNGNQSKEIPVRSGLRQGDPMSCPLYNLAIEPMALLANGDVRIQGVTLMDKTRVKMGQFADDTFWACSRQEDLDTIVEDIMPLVERATGSRMNKDKSRIQPINSTVTRQDIPSLQRHEPQVHLGIPVGWDIEEAECAHWRNLLDDMDRVSQDWTRAHLSMKGRVLIAGTLVLSKCRYTMRFLTPSRDTIAKAESMYFRLVWNGKDIGLINRASTLLPINKGGLNCQDVQSIAAASALDTFVRMEKRPGLPATLLAKELMIHAASKGRTASVRTGSLLHPWRQRVSARTPAGLGYLQGAWQIWTHEIGYAKVNESGGCILPSIPPQDVPELMTMSLWYSRLLKTEVGQGAKVFSGSVWEVLDGQSNAPRLIGDFWDTTDWTIKPQPCLERNQMRSLTKSLDSLQANLPDNVRALMSVGYRPQQGGREPTGEYNEIKLRDHTGTLLPLRAVDYGQIYKALVGRKTAGHAPLPEVLDGPYQAVRAQCSSVRTVTKAQIWSAVRDPEKAAKCGDLLFRFLHGKVRTGQKLTWLEDSKKTCPIDGAYQTIEHIWLHCESAKAVWQRYRTLWSILSRTPPVVPTSGDELIGFLAVEPYPPTQMALRARHGILYSSVVWAIWKAYTANNFGEQPLQSEAVVGLFQRILIGRISADRAAALNPIYGSARHNRRMFKAIWGIKPQELKLTKLTSWFDQVREPPGP